ncbi:hypothetical protein [Nocardia sp. NPDC058705]|uniref:hypothetical protein n=1 Tax=Nocardia sp. NPDC058705 TaxID=3346609 RepID=UPI003693769E
MVDHGRIADVPARARRAEGTVYAVSIAVIVGLMGLLTWKSIDTGIDAPSRVQVAFVTISLITVAASIFAVVVLWTGQRMPPLVRFAAMSILVLNTSVFLTSGGWLAIDTGAAGLLIVLAPIGLGMARVIKCVPATAR